MHETFDLDGLIPEMFSYSREIGATRIIDFLNRIHASEVFKDDTSKRKFIENLTFEDFARWLNRLNAEIKNLNEKEAQMDGNGCVGQSKKIMQNGNIGDYDLEMLKYGPQMTIYDAPEKEDREELLKKLFTHAKGMKNLNDMALLISANINALHLYPDGNGRLSRLLYFLIRNGYSGSEEENEEIKQIFMDRGYKKLSANPGLIQKDLLELLNQRMTSDKEDKHIKVDGIWSKKRGCDLWKFDEKKLSLNCSLSEKEKHQLVKLIHVEQLNCMVFYEFLEKTGQLDNKHIITKYAKTKTPKKFIDIDRILSELNPETAKYLINIWREMKRKYVELLIEVCSHEKDDGSEEAKLKEKFYKRIIEGAQASA